MDSAVFSRRECLPAGRVANGYFTAVLLKVLLLLRLVTQWAQEFPSVCELSLSGGAVMRVKKHPSLVYLKNFYLSEQEHSFRCGAYC